jgi:CRP-like cAMP-binding protein
VIQIFEIANHRVFKKGETVFEQGAFGDMTYIILSGSVSVLKRAEEFGNREVVVNTLRDG